MRCNCTKCIYCIRMDKYSTKMKCKKFQGEIYEPWFCRHYKTEKQYLKEQTKKVK